MLQEVMLKRRKEELELYKLFANDPAFKAAWQQSVERFVRNAPPGRGPDQGLTA
jgi:type I restriction enzyme R subunit